MRCEVIDRQAVGIAQTAAAFDALRDALGAGHEDALGAGNEGDATPLPAAPKSTAANAPAFSWPEAPDARAADDTPAAVEPPPAKNFTAAPLLDTLPPARAETGPPAEAGALDDPADDPFADMLFDADIRAETQDERVEEHTASIEGPFDSSQAKRLTRLINLFAGARAADATEPEPEPVSPMADAAMSAANVTIETAPAESIAPSAPPDQPAAQPEPADFLLEPWPHGPVPVAADPPAVGPDMQAPSAPEPAPAPKSRASAPVSAASLFPMSRPAPSDPLAPIVALSDEEKIALFS
jgi:hypothetical protein